MYQQLLKLAGNPRHLALINEERTFWQSRMTTNGKAAPLPELTDIHALAKEVRKTFRIET